MAHVSAADASGEVEVAVAVNVLEPRVFSLGDVDGRAVGEPARHSFRATLREGLGLRPRNGSAKLNSRHRDFSSLVVASYCFCSIPGTRYPQLGTRYQYHPIGASFRLMYTCFVSRYSSMPHGPSSRPNPDCLYPPQGASTYVGCMWLTQTIPARRAFTARI